jgi:hypothetical protein
MSAARITAMMRLLTLDSDRAAEARRLRVPELAETYRLTLEEAQAIHDRRLDVLHELGVHGVTMMQFARTFQFSIADRWAELKRDGRSG